MLTEEQLLMRQSGIGASEIAAVLGLSPWQTPLDVWMRKATPSRGPLVDGQIDNTAIKVGNFIEGPLRALYTVETGKSVQTCDTLRHQEHPFILATPDGIVHGDDRGLEIKVVGARSVRKWEEAENGIPDYVELQCRQNMAVTGLNYWDVAALLGGTDFRIFTVERDMEVENLIIEGATHFWKTYVEGDTPPPTEDVESKRAYLNALYPGRADKTLIAPNDPERFLSLCEGLIATTSELKEAEKRKKELETLLCEMVGDAYGVEHGGHKFTWGRQGGSIGYKAIAEAAHKGAIPEAVIEQFRGADKRVCRFTPAK